MEADDRVLNTYSVDVADDGGDARQTCAPTGDDAHVLVGVLAALALAVGMVVQIRHSLAQFCASERQTRT